MENGEGWTEPITSRWFAQGGGRREQTVLATKIYGRMGEWPNQGRLSALNFRQAAEAPLKRLQIEHIDRNTRWEDLWQATELLVQQGKEQMDRLNETCPGSKRESPEAFDWWNA